MPPKIVISGYVGFGNAGDEAIVEAVTGHLRALLPEVEITVVSGNPASTAEIYGVRAIGWRDTLAIAEAIRTTDLTVIGGGGLFQDYWGFDPHAILTREHWGLSFYVAPALISALFGKPVMLYAVGAGPLFSEHGRKYTKVAGDIATRITVRDVVTRELFESLGVCAGKIAVTADPAFDLAAAPEAAGLPVVREWKSAGPAIAVCVRNWSFGTDQTFCDRQVAAALDAVLASEGGRLLFLPFHVEPGTNDDVAAARRVAALLRHGEGAAVVAERYPPRMLAGIIGNADLVLGMRLHSVIFSVAAGVPFVALEYDPKIAGMTSLAGFEEFTIPLGGIESDVLAGRLRQALRERDRFSQLAGIESGELRRRARENAAMAVELLETGALPADYGPDARLLMGRMFMAQVASSAALVERVEACCRELEQPVDTMRPVETADSLVEKVKGLGRETNELRRQAAASNLELQDAAAARQALEAENTRLVRQLEAAAAAGRELEEENRALAGELKAAAASRDQLRAESRDIADRLQKTLAKAQEADTRAAALAWEREVFERRLVPLESKAPGAVMKRGVQFVLDVVQMLTPSPLRAAVRKYYLGFYFRVFPERRAGGPSS